MSGIIELARAHPTLGARLALELEEVGRIFERQLASDISAVNRLCLHVEAYRGKMLRPTLVLLSGLAGADDECAGISDRQRVLAAVVEMIHMATLVHDDVLDEANVRRRGSTVNALWGNEAAVMLGDYLISNAFHLCSSLGDPAISSAIGRITNTLCEGELLQLRHRDDYGIDRSIYTEIIDRKTASLIGGCCRLGAAMAGAGEGVQSALERYGAAVGLAFQVQDDLLDLAGEEAVVGKSLGRDLEKGKLTLPVILHLSSAGPAARSAALERIERRDGAGLRLMLLESGAVERSRAVAAEYVERARGAIAQMPDRAPVALLRRIADAVVDRAW